MDNHVGVLGTHVRSKPPSMLTECFATGCRCAENWQSSTAWTGWQPAQGRVSATICPKSGVLLSVRTLVACSERVRSSCVSNSLAHGESPTTADGADWAQYSVAIDGCTDRGSLGRHPVPAIRCGGARPPLPRHPNANASARYPSFTWYRGSYK